MPASNYNPPVSNLLEIGMPKTLKNGNCIDYVELYDLTEEHIDDLIRLASEQNLDWDSDLEGFAPIHAYRALGQLQAEKAVPDLLALLDENEYDEWLSEDLPAVLAMIGTACLPTLSTFLADETKTMWGRITASKCIQAIAQAEASQREACVQILTKQLSNYAKQKPGLNGFLVSNLLDLSAAESIEVIERAYTEGPMDESICGSLARVKISLGLATKTDFTPEELRHRDPEWMEQLKELAPNLDQLSERLNQSFENYRDLTRIENGLAPKKKKNKTQKNLGFATLPKKSKKKRQ